MGKQSFRVKGLVEVNDLHQDKNSACVPFTETNIIRRLQTLIDEGYFSNLFVLIWKDFQTANSIKNPESMVTQNNMSVG
jgi:hypothetical protein